MKFWAIVGDKSTRKSSTIRALTGIRARSQCWEMQLQGMPSQVFAYVEMCALQELGRSAAQFVSDVQAAAQKQSITHVLVPLRENNRRHGAALHYINYFQNSAGWILLGQETLPSPPTPDRPTNLIAADLRSRWGIA